jgi:hypothetical protein
VQTRMFVLSGIELEPFEFRLKKFTDRVGKLLIWQGLESVIWSSLRKILIAKGLRGKY